MITQILKEIAQIKGERRMRSTNKFISTIVLVVFLFNTVAVDLTFAQQISINKTTLAPRYISQLLAEFKPQMDTIVSSDRPPDPKKLADLFDARAKDFEADWIAKSAEILAARMVVRINELKGKVSLDDAITDLINVVSITSGEAIRDKLVAALRAELTGQKTYRITPDRNLEDPTAPIVYGFLSEAGIDRIDFKEVGKRVSSSTDEAINKFLGERDWEVKTLADFVQAMVDSPERFAEIFSYSRDDEKSKHYAEIPRRDILRAILNLTFEKGRSKDTLISLFEGLIKIKKVRALIPMRTLKEFINKIDDDSYYIQDAPAYEVFLTAGELFEHLDKAGSFERGVEAVVRDNHLARRTLVEILIYLAPDYVSLDMLANNGDVRVTAVERLKRLGIVDVLEKDHEAVMNRMIGEGYKTLGDAMKIGKRIDALLGQVASLPELRDALKGTEKDRTRQLRKFLIRTNESGYYHKKGEAPLSVKLDGKLGELLGLKGDELPLYYTITVSGTVDTNGVTPIKQATDLAGDMVPKNALAEVFFDGGKTVLIVDGDNYLAVTAVYGDEELFKYNDVNAKGGVRIYDFKGKGSDEDKAFIGKAIEGYIKAFVDLGTLGVSRLEGPDMRPTYMDVADIMEQIDGLGVQASADLGKELLPFTTSGHPENGYFSHDEWRVTSLSVLESMCALLENEEFCKKFGINKDEPRKIIIQGFGEVGSNLIRLLHENREKYAKYNFVIVGVSDMDFGAYYNADGITVEELYRLAEDRAAALKAGRKFEFNPDNYKTLSNSANRVHNLDDIIFYPTTFLIPAGPAYIIKDKDMASELQCKVITPAANAPLGKKSSTPTEVAEIEKFILERGIAPIPAWLINHGGIVASKEEVIHRLVEGGLEQLKRFEKRGWLKDHVTGGDIIDLSWVNIYWALYLWQNENYARPLGGIMKDRVSRILKYRKEMLLESKDRKLSLKDDVLRRDHAIVMAKSRVLLEDLGQHADNLKNVLSDKTALLKDRRVAAYVIGRTGDRLYAKPLLDILDDDNESGTMYRNAAGSLGYLLAEHNHKADAEDGIKKIIHRLNAIIKKIDGKTDANNHERRIWIEWILRKIDGQPLSVDIAQKPVERRADRPARASKTPAGQTTPLYDWHKANDGNTVDFHGWIMPVQYSGKITDEHLAVRKSAGLFDIAHMGVLEVSGKDAFKFLQRVTTNDVFKLNYFDIQYSYITNQSGEVIDDIMVCKLADDKYLLVVNASNTEKVKKWLGDNKPEGVVIDDMRNSERKEDRKVMLALQGPRSIDILHKLSHIDLNRIGYFTARHVTLGDIKVLISRTGYTGEKGYEIFVHPDQAEALWNKILEAGKEYGIAPCGLAARDSLRIEAGLPLYGNELAGESNISPFEAGYGDFVVFTKAKGDYLGREALLNKRDAKRETVTLVITGKEDGKIDLNTKGMPLPTSAEENREASTVYAKLPGGVWKNIGNVTSRAVQSPTWRKEGFAENVLLTIALIDKEYAISGAEFMIKTRGKECYATMLPRNFYDNAGDRYSREYKANYIPNTPEAIAEILRVIGVNSADELFRVVPDAAQFKGTIQLPAPMNRMELFLHMLELSRKNKTAAEMPSFLGAGAYHNAIPEIVGRVTGQRAMYTSYTPYQPEIMQGTLEAIYLFQSLICKLTGMEVANASLYDGGSATAEAALMAHRITKGKKRIVVAGALNPYYKQVLATYVKDVGLEIVETPVTPATGQIDFKKLEEAIDENTACVIAQQPNFLGCLEAKLKDVAQSAHSKGALFIVNVNLSSLALLDKPSLYDADIVVAEGQTLGNHLNYGGPYLGVMAAKKEHVRQMPGRLVGKTVDTKGRPGYVLTLGTREQHIKRERATSNICSNEALCALAAAAYMISVGDKGFAESGLESYSQAIVAMARIQTIPGFGIAFPSRIFNEFVLESAIPISELNKLLYEKGIMGGLDVSAQVDSSRNLALFSFTDMTSDEDVEKLTDALREISRSKGLTEGDYGRVNAVEMFSSALVEQKTDITGVPDISVEKLWKYFHGLAAKNFGIDDGLYPLGSCTMKYNPRIDEDVAGFEGFTELHPLQSEETSQGTLELLYNFEQMLCKICGFSRFTLQPAAGAHGEFTGLKIIKAYQASIGHPERDVIITPDSSHGTNPASSAMAGFKVVQIDSNKKTGTISLAKLKAAIEENKGRIAGIMITNPNTLGLFEKDITEVSRIIHEAGGLVYMDGANMNAVIGKVKPGEIGIDILHLNLHKTFATPHGGGGPGAGPVGVRTDLVRFLPKPFIEFNGERYLLDYNKPASIGKVQSYFGNIGVIVKAYAYLRTLGYDGLKAVSENAVINANYMLARLRRDPAASKAYALPFAPYTNRMHEFVINPSKDMETAMGKSGHDITMGIAKILQDRGFHPPTVFFPLIAENALMIEPTETAPKAEMDRFCNVLIEIARRAFQDAATLSKEMDEAPTTMSVSRLDDLKAVKDLDLANPDIMSIITAKGAKAPAKEESAVETAEEREPSREIDSCLFSLQGSVPAKDEPMTFEDGETIEDVIPVIEIATKQIANHLLLRSDGAIDLSKTVVVTRKGFREALSANRPTDQALQDRYKIMEQDVRKLFAPEKGGIVEVPEGDFAESVKALIEDGYKVIVLDDETLSKHLDGRNRIASIKEKAGVDYCVITTGMLDTFTSEAAPFVNLNAMAMMGVGVLNNDASLFQTAYTVFTGKAPERDMLDRIAQKILWFVRALPRMIKFTNEPREAEQLSKLFRAAA